MVVTSAYSGRGVIILDSNIFFEVCKILYTVSPSYIFSKPVKFYIYRISWNLRSDTFFWPFQGAEQYHPS